MMNIIHYIAQQRKVSHGRRYCSHYIAVVPFNYKLTKSCISGEFHCLSASQQFRLFTTAHRWPYCRHCCHYLALIISYNSPIQSSDFPNTAASKFNLKTKVGGGFYTSPTDGTTSLTRK